MFNNLFVCLFRPIQSTKPAGVNNTIDHTKERKFLVRIYRSLKKMKIFIMIFTFDFKETMEKATNFYWPVIIHNLNIHTARGESNQRYQISFLEIQLMSESRSRFFFVFFLSDWLIDYLIGQFMVIVISMHTHTHRLSLIWEKRKNIIISG